MKGAIFIWGANWDEHEIDNYRNRKIKYILHASKKDKRREKRDEINCQNSEKEKGLTKWRDWK